MARVSLLVHARWDTIDLPRDATMTVKPIDMKPSERYHDLKSRCGFGDDEAFRLLSLQILDELHERRVALDEQHAAGQGETNRSRAAVAAESAVPVAGEPQSGWRVDLTEIFDWAEPLPGGGSVENAFDRLGNILAEGDAALAQVEARTAELEQLRAKAWRQKLSLRGVVSPCRQCGDELAKCLEQQCCVGCNHATGAPLPAPPDVSKWIACADSLPDSEVWVVAVNQEADYQVVQLEFTDDSEGCGEPYWVSENNVKMTISSHPHWAPLAEPPEAVTENEKAPNA